MVSGERYRSNMASCFVDEKENNKVRIKFTKMEGLQLAETDPGEHKFWSRLIEYCLKPDVNAFGQTMQLKSKKKLLTHYCTPN